MPGAKWDLESVRRRIGRALNAVGPETVILALLAVGYDRGAGCFELPDGVFDRLVIGGVQGWGSAIARGPDRFE